MDASSCLAVSALQTALVDHVPPAMAQLLQDFERRSMEAEDLRAHHQRRSMEAEALLADHQRLRDLADNAFWREHEEQMEMIRSRIRTEVGAFIFEG